MSNESKIKVAVDCMGGNGAQMILEAIATTARQFPEVCYLLCGQENLLQELVKKHNLPDNQYEIIPSYSVISDNDKATEALKNKKDSSMRRVIEMVKSGKADAAISGGNTGALMVTGRMLLGSLKAVKRPAIACIFPTKGLPDEKAILLDMGANINCDEKDLSNFAIMGSVFARIILEKNNPTVSILNVGEEETKGREIEQKTQEILRDILQNFQGFLEANHVIFGKSDVIITDGFSGNIFLKASEGTAKILLQQLKRAINSNLITKICGFFLKKHLKRELSLLDPKEHNGAILLGLKGIVVKSHGSADKVAFISAIRTTIRLVESKIIEKLELELNKITKDNTDKPFLNTIKDYFSSTS
jgi:glycerol-3-phosphate acyltransferase PlsX